MENNQLPNENGQLPQPVSPVPHSPTGGEKVIQPLSQDLQPIPLVNPTPPPVQPPVQPSAAIPPPPAPVSSGFITPDPLVPPTPASMPNDPYAGLSGSQMQQRKQPLPVGVYIIAGFSFLSFIISFFDSSQSSSLYTIAMLLDLLLAIGLLLRLEVARKLIVWLSGLILVLTVVSSFLLVGFQQKLETAKTNYEKAVSKIDPVSLTPDQQQQLQDLREAIAAQEKKAGKAITFSYIKLGVTAVETIVVIMYLTRPKVKAVFHQLEA